MTQEDERDEAHAELAKERWQAHRETHAAEKELAAQYRESHADQHASIARNLAEYKAQSNEWRGSLSDLRTTFAPISRLDALDAQVERRFDELSKRIDTEREERRDQQNLRVGQEEGVSKTTAIIVGALGVIGTVLGALAVLVNIIRAP